MKLIDLFLKTPIIEEIALPFDHDNIPEFNSAFSKIIGTANGFDIWGSRFYGNQADTYGILDSNNKPIAYIIIIEKSSNHEIFKIWVSADHRGKSLATSLIYFIVKKLKIKLLSGQLATNLGVEFLKRIFDNTKFSSSVIDVNSNVVSNKFDDVLKRQSYQILIEGNIGDDRLFGHSFLNINPIMKEYNLFDGDL